MRRDLLPDSPDDAFAELQRLASHVRREDVAERQKALERRVEELIAEHGWEHLRVDE